MSDTPADDCKLLGKPTPAMDIGSPLAKASEISMSMEVDVLMGDVEQFRYRIRALEADVDRLLKAMEQLREALS